MLRKKLFEAIPQASHISGLEEEKSGLMDLSLQNCPLEEVSTYFPNHPGSHILFADHLLKIQHKLNCTLSEINFCKSPIHYVYNPTEYASVPYQLYMKKYCLAPKKLLFVGMNPGPFGMCQTGVPFGDTNWVKNWLQIEGPVSKPSRECPKRPIEGFNCSRKEQSGDRFWRFWSDMCGTPENFFRNAFVYNYCPLAFMDEKGRNVTPADIKDCKQLESICDKFYLDVVNLMQPDVLVAIGRYIEKRTLTVFTNTNTSVTVLCMPHPSPRAVNNHNWPDKAKLFLETHELVHFFQ